MNTLFFDKARVIFGAGVTLISLLSALWLGGGHISSILQLAAFMIVLGGIAAAGIMGFRWNDAGGSWLGLLFLQGIGRNDKSFSHPLACRRLGSMAKGAMAAGIVGSISGMIHVMENLDKPELIGPGVAVAFVSSVYSICAWLWCYALQQAHFTATLEQGLIPADGPDRVDVPVVAFAAMLLLLLSLFVVLYSLNKPKDVGAAVQPQTSSNE